MANLSMLRSLSVLLFMPLLLGVGEGTAQVDLQAVEEESEQDRLRQLRNRLETRTADHPGLEERVELSVNDVTVKEFIRGLGNAHDLNVSVSGEVEGTIVNNFTNARVADVFLYLCKQYSLDIEFIGSIMNFVKYDPPEPEPEPEPKEPPKVNYQKEKDFISLDLKEDSVEAVAEEITRITLHNVIVAPEARGKKMSVFIQNRPFDDALEKMALANGLRVEETDDNFYVLRPAEEDEEEGSQGQRRRTAQRGNGDGVDPAQPEGLSIEVHDDGRLTVKARKVPIVDVIEAVSERTVKSHFVYSAPDGKADLYIDNATYDEFLSYILNGTGHTFKESKDSIYLIGEREQERLRHTELIQIENRTVEDLLESIPSELRDGVDIQEYIELNSLVVSGSHPKIRELKAFIRKVDQVVPVVMIEVMIVDVQKNRTIETDLDVGVGGEDAPESSGGEVSGSGGADYQFDSESLNQLIGSFNGFGLVNLGRVTPDFYVNLQALEERGILNTRSTPQLSTMNGHEANMKIGEKEYYLEVQNNVIGSQNPQVVNTQNYKSINADLAITIKPVVTGDEQVTMEVQVEQSDFTGRISQTAPPGSVTRNFNSRVRVRNGELVLLGGLEDRTNENSSSGLPLLSRIPVLKWLFSGQTRRDNESRLNVFIKPTILY